MQTEYQRRAEFSSAQRRYDNASPPDTEAEYAALEAIESDEFNRLQMDDGEIADSLGTVEFTSGALLALVNPESTTRQLLSAAYSIRNALIDDFEKRAEEAAPELLQELLNSAY